MICDKVFPLTKAYIQIHSCYFEEVWLLGWEEGGVDVFKVGGVNEINMSE